jgi:hypothetical protein
VLRLEEKERRHKASRVKHFLNIMYACKPHKQSVTSLAVDPEGKILATGVREGREGW